jgi:hypothetical protein
MKNKQKNIIKKVLELVNSRGWVYRIDSTGVDTEQEITIWVDDYSSIELYYDETDDYKFPNIISWTEYGTIYHTDDFDTIVNVIEKKLKEIF